MAAERATGSVGLAVREILPREHGVWFMWIVPVLAGAAAGGVRWAHLLVALSALLSHLASSAALGWVRAAPRRPQLLGWALGLGLGAAAAMAYPLRETPQLAAVAAAAVALLGVNAAFARARLERLLLNDVAAIAGLELWAPIAYAVGAGAIDRMAWLLWAFCFVFFVGTAFHVKTLFRERGNRRFKWVSNALHLAMVAAPAAAGIPEAALAYLPSALRTWLMPAGLRVRPIVAGVIEISNSLLFLALLWRLFILRVDA